MTVINSTSIFLFLGKKSDAVLLSPAFEKKNVRLLFSSTWFLAANVMRYKPSALMVNLGLEEAKPAFERLEDIDEAQNVSLFWLVAQEEKSERRQERVKVVNHLIRRVFFLNWPETPDQLAQHALIEMQPQPQTNTGPSELSPEQSLFLASQTGHRALSSTVLPPTSPLDFDGDKPQGGYSLPEKNHPKRDVFSAPYLGFASDRDRHLRPDENQAFKLNRINLNKEEAHPEESKPSLEPTSSLDEATQSKRVHLIQKSPSDVALSEEIAHRNDEAKYFFPEPLTDEQQRSSGPKTSHLGSFLEKTCLISSNPETLGALTSLDHRIKIWLPEFAKQISSHHDARCLFIHGNYKREIWLRKGAIFRLSSTLPEDQVVGPVTFHRMQHFSVLCKQIMQAKSVFEIHPYSYPYLHSSSPHLQLDDGDTFPPPFVEPGANTLLRCLKACFELDNGELDFFDHYLFNKEYVLSWGEKKSLFLDCLPSKTELRVVEESLDQPLGEALHVHEHHQALFFCLLLLDCLTLNSVQVAPKKEPELTLLAPRGEKDLFHSTTFSNQTQESGKNLRGDIFEQLVRCRELNYFDVLHVDHKASTREIREAFVLLKRKYESFLFKETGPFLEPGELKEILSVLEEAYEVLRDEKKRETYAKRLTHSS